MVVLVVFNSFNVVKNLKKPDLVARQKPQFYTTGPDYGVTTTELKAKTEITYKDKSLPVL